MFKMILPHIRGTCLPGIIAKRAYWKFSQENSTHSKELLKTNLEVIILGILLEQVKNARRNSNFSKIENGKEWFIIKRICVVILDYL